MNWYLIIAIIAAFLTGWAVGTAYGTRLGYAAALKYYQGGDNEE